MKKGDYKYKRFDQIELKLKEKGYHKLDNYLINSPLTSRIEMWVGKGDNLLIEVFRDGFCAIYKDSKDI
jgi:hypothetical protein